ncbi:MAG: hypothetical protein DRG71_08200, partial [Deltaproteobacteria bacterium]
VVRLWRRLKAQGKRQKANLRVFTAYRLSSLALGEPKFDIIKPLNPQPHNPQLLNSSIPHPLNPQSPP